MLGNGVCRLQWWGPCSHPYCGVGGVNGWQIYAMKVLYKSDLMRRNQVERIRTERQVMASIRHPFIVRLFFAFHNQDRVFLVMDFVQGGDFFTLMRYGRITILPRGLASHDQALTYVGCSCRA